MKLYLSVIVFFIASLSVLNAQRFTASAVGGINISQINGDGYAGYNKWGLTGGARVSYEVYPKMDMSIEMLYSQRGSRNGNQEAPFHINLNYVEIPLLYSINDWYNEADGYYKVRADVGLSYGYLISSTQTLEGFTDALNNLNTHDVSFLVGAGFKLNKQWGLGFRYSRSLYRMYNDDDFENAGLLGYFLTVRGEYTF